MTVNDAVAKRISALLKEKGISQYKLEQESGIQHGSMQCIMNGRNKTVTLSTVMMIAKGFGISLLEFLDDEIILTDHTSVSKLKYSNIEKIKEKNNVVMIFMNNNMALRLYKDAFVEGSWEECKKKINDMLK